MKKHRLIAYLLSLALFISILPMTLSAADTTYQLVAENTVTVDGTTDQTVEVYFQSIGDEKTYSLEADWSTNETGETNYLTLTTLTAPEGISPTQNDATSGHILWTDQTWTGVATNAGGNIWTAVYTVSKDTPAGEYSVTLTGKTTDSSYGENNFGTLTATITVTEPTAPSLYTLSAPGYDEANGVAVGETVQIALTINQAFNCAEIEINYPADYVEYQAKEEWVDGADRIEVEKGENSLKLLHIGAAKENYTYVLEFEAIGAVETAEFSVTSMAFGTTSEAIETGAAEKVETNLLTETCEIKIVEGYTVELDDIFESEQTAVAHNGSFTFKVESQTGEYYENYTVTSVKMGETYLDLTTSDQLTHDEANNTWTIKNVTGNLVIEGERTAKSYDVIWVDDDNVMSDADKTETYAKLTYDPENDYSIAIGDKDGYTVSVTAMIGDKSVGEYDPDTKTLYIKGTNVTDVITITVTATELEDITITVSGSDVVIKETDGSGLTSTSVKAGTEVTLKLKPAFGYTYSVVVGSGDPVDFNENNEYTFTATATNDDPTVEEEIKVIVTKTLNYTANVGQYVQLNGTSMWLVTIKTGDAPLTNEDKNYAFKYTFGDETVTMSWSDNYKAYAALVIADANPAGSLTYDLVEVTTVTNITYDYNINGSANNSVDINDAQLVWNMYNQIYDGVTSNVTLEKFWKADVNNDQTINVGDALVIVNEILGRTAQ